MPSIHPTYHPAHFVFPTKRGWGKEEKQAYIGVGVGALLSSSLLCAKYHVNIICGGGEGGEARDRAGGRERGEMEGRQSRKDSGKFG